MSPTRLLPAPLIFICTMLFPCEEPAEAAQVRKLLLTYPEQALKGQSISVGAVACTAAGSPVPKAEVRFEAYSNHLELPIVERTTDANGFAQYTFKCPERISGVLQIMCMTDPRYGAASRLGFVQIGEDWRLLASTDKDVYQPGQTIRGRALCLGTESLSPCRERSVRIELVNQRDTVVAVSEGPSSRFGVVPFAFELADEILPGTYRVRCLADGRHSRPKELTVRRYRLPRIVGRIEPERRELAVGQTLSGTVHAEFSHGDVCSEARIELRIVAPDRGTELRRVHGVTDKEGNWPFKVELGKDLLQPDSSEQTLALLARVTDGAGDEGRCGTTLTVTQNGHVTFLPEAGYLVGGRVNRVYVVCAGEQARQGKTQISLSVSGQVIATQGANRLGMAAFEVPVKETGILQANVRAGDETVTTVKEFAVSGRDEILVQPSRSLARVGETIEVGLTVPSSVEMIVLSLVSAGGQTIDMFAGTPGRLSGHELVIPDQAFGILTIKAEAMTALQPVEGRARICVIGGRDIPVTIRGDRVEYRPRDEAILALHAAMPEPVPRIAELKITDESLRGLGVAESDPVRAELYLAGHDVSRQIAGLSLLDLHEAKAELPAAERQLLAAALLAPSPKEAAAGSRYGREAPLTADPQEAARRPRPVPASDTTNYSKYIRIYRSKGVPDEKVEKVLFKMGLCLILSSRYREAGDFYMTFANEMRGNTLRPAAFYWAGDSYAKAGDSHRAYQAMKRAIWDYPDSKWAKYARGRLTAPVFDRIAEMDGGGGGGGGGFGRVGPAPPKRKEPKIAKPAAPAAHTAKAPKVTVEEVRSFFPETLLYDPELHFDDQGRARLAMPLPDSITQWNVRSFVTTLDGHIGTGSTKLKVVKPFFVSLRLPYQMMVGDEVEAVAVVHNDTGKEKKVTIACAADHGIELLGVAPKKLRVPSGERQSVRISIRATHAGAAGVTVRAEARRVRDAVRRSVRVDPARHPKMIQVKGELTTQAEHTLDIHETAFTENGRLELRLYPSPADDLTEATAALIRMPYGCFEQTVSVNYPSVMAATLLKSLGWLTPEAEQRAKRFVNLGYQRMLSYEVPGGGFHWWGRAPANVSLTAYGLLHLTDLAGVTHVDKAVVKRTRNWLLQQRDVNGAWRPPGNSDLLKRAQVTAYVCHALLCAGVKAEEVKRGFGFAERVRKMTKDTYLTALLANAALAGGAERPVTDQILAELAKQAVDEGAGTCWPPKTGTTVRARGRSAIIETTALAVLAFRQSGSFPELAKKGLTYLLDTKCGRAWGTTQATAMALKALCACHEMISIDEEVRVTLVVADNEKLILTLQPGAGAPVRQFGIPKPGEYAVHLASNSTKSLRYVVRYPHNAPWDVYERSPMPTLFAKTVAEDESRSFTLGERTTFVTALRNTGDFTIPMPLARIKLPPGFEADETDFDHHIRAGKLARAAVSADEVVLYMDELLPKRLLEIDYTLRPTFTARAQFPGTEVYEYYTPENRYTAKIWSLEVARKSGL